MCGVLPKGAKSFYIWYSIITSSLTLLDTAALGLIALTVTPLIGNLTVKLPVIGEIQREHTVWLLLIICLLFVIKGAFAVALHWYATRRFASYELAVGQQLFDAYIRAPWAERSRYSTAEVTRIVDGAMANANMQFIVPLSHVPGNFFTFMGVLSVLIITQPIIALLSFVYLALISLVMLRVISRRSGLAGETNRNISYRVATVMTEMVQALKEVTLRGKLNHVAEVVRGQRQSATKARADLSFYVAIPKHMLDAALIGGFLLVGGASYLLGGAESAVVSLAMFAATGFRMIPALNSIQGSISLAKAAEVYARDVITELKRANISRGVVAADANASADTALMPQNPQQLRLRNVNFRYAGADKNVLSDINLEIPFGSRVAIVGPSGAGKSTLVDILLGLSVPTSGKITIDNISLNSILQEWRSRVGYVPQKVAVFDGTVAQNVALTWGETHDSERILRVLAQAELSDICDRRDGLNAKMGENGAQISGGQQQRLGIARALYTDPLIMVLDEATSSLDTETEKRVMEAMNTLAGEVTFITIAHRLATVRDYDLICYVADGKIRSVGSFAEVARAVPEFRKQAELAGLGGELS
nr:ABC transporter ATP-binding protein [Canibacter zhuwentaonis]